MAGPVPGPTAGPDGYAAAVAAWTEHLRGGGTLPWAAWTAAPRDPTHAHADAPTDAPTEGPTARVADGRVADGPHLELLRRLTLQAGRPLGGLADLVLSTAAPGRGPVDVPLPWPGHEPAFGSRPVDPAQLPPEHLVRLAAGLLTRLLPGVPLRPALGAHDGPAARWPLPWRPRFRVHGSPLTAAVVRRELLAAGAVESDWRPVHLVVARPLEQMVAEHWTAASHRGGILRWGTLWRRSQARDRLPAPVDVAALAARLHARGATVHVVVAADVADAVRLAGPVVGTGALPSPGAYAGPDLAGSDLLRRVNRLAPLGEAPRATTARLVQVLAGLPRPAEPPPRAPGRFRDWTAHAAARLADDLTRADYPVHGDPAALEPRAAGPRVPPGGPRRSGAGGVDAHHTLEVALAACLATWQQQEGRPRGD